MRNQTLVDTIHVSGNFSPNPDAIASLSIINDPSYVYVSYDDEAKAADEIATFLLGTVPHGILAEVLEQIAIPVSQLPQLGDLFDELAMEVLSTRVDPGVNAYFADKQQLFNGGAASTDQMTDFIHKAIEYAGTPR